MDRRILIGSSAGVILALAYIAAGGYLPSVTRSATQSTNHGPLLADTEGALRELVIHYVPDAGEMVERAYRDLLAQLPDDVTVYVVCPDMHAYRDLCQRLGNEHCRVQPVIVGHQMTTWSRDRWLAFEGKLGRTTVLSPHQEQTSASWPARAGDQLIGEDLARLLDVRSLRSSLHFDGGDFVADEETVFVTPRVLRRNAHRLSREEILARLQKRLQRQVVILEEAPEHHAGMFMALVGNRTALVGDPSLARHLASGKCRSGGKARCAQMNEYDFSSETQRLFDAVAAQCERSGYRVVRMPVLAGRDRRTYETPLNVIFDQRDGVRSVYMPTYRHNRRLAAHATRIWQELGFVVRPVDCTETYVHAGSLRCLVNVLRRETA